MGRSEWRLIDDLFILTGIGLVGFMAYNEWYKGKGLEEVAADIDSKVRAFLDSIEWPALPMPQIPQVQYQQQEPQQPQIQYPEIDTDTSATTPTPVSYQQQEPVASSPSRTNTIPEPAVKEQTQQPSGGTATIIGIAGDWQNSSAASSVAKAMEQAGVQFVIANGDYNGGNIPSVLGKQYQGRMVGSKGNHDGGSDYNMFGQSSWNTATKINSVVGVVTMDNNGISESELDKLTAQLKNGGCKIIIYSMHMPCVTASGDHHQPGENKNCSAIESVAAKYGVQLLVNGHNHYYGRFNKNGRTYCTIGTAGGDRRSGDGGGGAVKVVKGQYGFLKCTTSANSLKCEFVNTSLSVLDSFTITAGTAATTAYLYATPYIQQQYLSRMRPRRQSYAVFR